MGTPENYCFKNTDLPCRSWCRISNPEERQKVVDAVHEKLIEQGMPNPSELTNLPPEKHGEWVKKINEALARHCEGGTLQNLLAEFEHIREEFPAYDRD